MGILTSPIGFIKGIKSKEERVVSGKLKYLKN